MRDLRPLFEPRSVAIVGASNDPAKWGRWLARGALRGEHRRSVFLVNRRGGEVLDRPAYPSLSDLPERPELVVLAVPASAFEETVDEALEVGARAIVAISAGLGELGGEAQALEAAVVGRVRAAGAVLLGPNCNGFCDAAAEIELGLDEIPAGPIGFVSQSGNLCYEVAQLAADVGLGLSRVVSIGNQADLDAAAIVESLGTDPHTRVIAAYVEDFRDGRAFARAAAAAGTPSSSSPRAAARQATARRVPTPGRSRATPPRSTPPAVPRGSCESAPRASSSTRPSSFSHATSRVVGASRSSATEEAPA